MASGYANWQVPVFLIMGCISAPDGKRIVVPLYELIAAESNPQEKDHLAEELRKSARIFKNLPEDAAVPLQSTYDVF